MHGGSWPSAFSWFFLISLYYNIKTTPNQNRSMKSVVIWTEIVMIIFKFWREDILIGGIVKMSSKSNFSSSSIWMYSGRNVQIIPLYQKFLRGLSIKKSPSLRNASKFAIFLEYKTDEVFSSFSISCYATILLFFL